MNNNVTPLLPETLAYNLEIFEIKQLAEKEAAYKEMCHLALKRYKKWKKIHSDQTDIIELLYGSMEGHMYRNVAIESIQLYWSIRKHFRISFTRYLEKTGCYPTETSVKKMRA